MGLQRVRHDWATLKRKGKNWSSRHVWRSAYPKDSLIKYCHVINLIWQSSICPAGMTSVWKRETDRLRQRGREKEGRRETGRGFIDILFSWLQLLVNIQSVWNNWEVFKVFLKTCICHCAANPLCGPLLAICSEQISVAFIWITSSFTGDTSALLSLGGSSLLPLPDPLFLDPCISHDHPTTTNTLHL